MPDRPIVALNGYVLLRLSRLNIGQRDALVFGLISWGAVDLFWTVIHPDRPQCAAPFYDLVQR